jgi:hydroxysqualene synthase
MTRSWTEGEAFDYCSRLTRAHYENFPVGSWLIPAALQPAVHSLYAFMRTADDFSDEDRQPGDEAERMAWLESWESMLADSLSGEGRHPIFIALRSTLSRHELPAQWLRDLLHAFKMDVTVRRYVTFQDLLGYCRYSANPVGRLILTLFGYRDEELYQLSDAICTGLQLANHWQDVAVDLKKDRIYIPQDDLRKFGVNESWLFGQNVPSSQPSPDASVGRRGNTPSPVQRTGEGGGEGTSFKQLLAFEVERAREFFAQGRTLPERVSGRLRWELRLTRLGGMRILDKIQAVDCDVFARRPVVTKWDWAMIALRTFI